MVPLNSLYMYLTYWKKCNFELLFFMCKSLVQFEYYCIIVYNLNSGML